jgi:hypothetical protein
MNPLFRKLAYIIVVLVCCSIITSCNSGGSFVGKWRDKDNFPTKITIEKSNNSFTVTYSEKIMPYMMYERSFITSAELKNGILELERNSGFPKSFSTTITYSSNMIFFNGYYYKKAQ